MICKRFENCIADCEKDCNIQGECFNHKQRSKCILSSDRRSRVICFDHGKRYTLLNTKENLVSNFQIDKGVIKEDASVPQNTHKCDNVLILTSDQNGREAVLVELKGGDISTAIKQLLSTYILFETVFHSCAHIYARCVSNNKIPNLQASPSYANLVKKLGKTGNYKHLKSEFEERDDQLGA